MPGRDWIVIFSTNRRERPFKVFIAQGEGRATGKEAGKIVESVVH